MMAFFWENETMRRLLPSLSQELPAPGGFRRNFNLTLKSTRHFFENGWQNYFISAHFALFFVFVEDKDFQFHSKLRLPGMISILKKAMF